MTPYNIIPYNYLLLSPRVILSWTPNAAHISWRMNQNSTNTRGLIWLHSQTQCVVSGSVVCRVCGSTLHWIWCNNGQMMARTTQSSLAFCSQPLQDIIQLQLAEWFGFCLHVNVRILELPCSLPMINKVYSGCEKHPGYATLQHDWWALPH